jgi:hypothetical protein
MHVLAMQFHNAKGGRMKRMLFWFLALLILLGTCASVSSNRGQKYSLPVGTSVSAGPVLNTMQPVVDVYIVQSGIVDGEFVVRGVRMRNLSDKAVAAVKVGWRLYMPDDPSSTLASGETPFLGVSLAPSENRFIPFPIAHGRKILESTGGRPSGHFRFEVFTTEVMFQDQMQHFLHGPSPADELIPEVVPVALADDGCDDPLPPEGGDPSCQDQECRWETDCYRCRDMAGSTCAAKPNDCNNCCSGRCKLSQEPPH